MAAGHRKIKVNRITIVRGVPVMCEARWSLEVENSVAADVETHEAGTTRFQLAASGATFNAMTGSAIRSAVSAAVAADTNVPANDGITV